MARWWFQDTPEGVRKLLGAILGLIGLVVLFRALPPAFWLALVGLALLVVGWLVYAPPGGALKK